MENNVFDKSSLLKGLKKFKGLGITISILLIIIGVCMCILPRWSTIVWVSLFVVGLVLSGIMNIIKFCADKKGERQGWILANAIISVVLGGLLITFVCLDIESYSGDAIDVIAYEVGSLVFWLILFAGWFAMFKGIFRLVALNATVAAGGNKTYEITSGVIEIVIGCLVVFLPWFGVPVLYWVGIYAIAISMIVSGIVIFADLVATPNISKELRKEKKHKEADVVDAEVVEEEKE